MTTRRERLERKLEKRQEWAESRQRKAARSFAAARQIGDKIPFGQPILVGHHSEGRARRDAARIHSNMRRGVESSEMAQHHSDKADGLERQLERSIFSDDPDAPERLRERIAELEAQREEHKRINKIYKAGGISAVLADVGPERAEIIARNIALQPYYDKPYPPYSLQNLGGNIRRLKKRRESIERDRAVADNPPPPPPSTGTVTHDRDWTWIKFQDSPPTEVQIHISKLGARYSQKRGAWYIKRHVPAADLIG